ncbi:MAG: heme o synthase, partial [Chloroflexota bacterium]|nr:heme o synthase [Chloroflexota bacterium]
MTAVDTRPARVVRRASIRSGTRRQVGARGFRETAAAYVALTKPRIIELLLVTTVPTMFLAAGGVPPLDLVAATLLGGTLAAGSANALNCYLDRDIDVVMRRTARRPLATGVLRPVEALVFGTVLGVLAVVWLTLAVNVLSAALALAAIVFYVAVYTMGLKRRTPQNIVWGGAAGCMPVLIGWAAVTGSLSWTPLVLFAVIFFWTPPHYWPLSLRFRDDYAAAGVPMLPVVVDDVGVTRRILGYGYVMA